MGAVNIDAKLVQNTKAFTTEENDDTAMLQMENGCICCTFRDDILSEIQKMLESSPTQFDCLVIECSGIAEPYPLAETFTVAERSGAEVVKLFRLDTMVTVVDSDKFLENYQSADRLTIRKELKAEGTDTRHVSQLLVAQVETSNVIVMNKMDLMTAERTEKLKAILKSLNSSAKIIQTEQSKVELDEILCTGLFDSNSLGNLAGIDLDDAVLHSDLAAERFYGIKSFVYRRRRPFHPAR
eukprot:992383_1